jgi:hypothetical protein
MANEYFFIRRESSGAESDRGMALGLIPGMVPKEYEILSIDPPLQVIQRKKKKLEMYLDESLCESNSEIRSNSYNSDRENATTVRPLVA